MLTIERIPAARHRVRVTRIGYERWRSEAFQLYQDVTPGLEAIQAGDTTEARRFAVRLVLPEVYWKHTRRLRSDTVTRVVDRPMATRSPDELAPSSPSIPSRWRTNGSEGRCDSNGSETTCGSRRRGRFAPRG